MNKLINPRINVLGVNYCRRSTWQVNDVRSPFWRLYFNDRKGARIWVGGKQVAILPDSVYLIPNYTRFTGELKNDVNHLFIHFSENLGFRGDGKTVFRFPRPKGFVERARCLGRLKAESPVSALRLSMEAYECVLSVLKLIPPHWFQTAEINEELQASLDYIEANFEKDLIIKDIARSAGMSVNRYIERFRDYVGEPPKSYIVRLRIERACLLLTQTDLSIDSIAGQTGFANRYYFSTVFKQRIATSPVKYRKLWRGSD